MADPILMAFWTSWFNSCRVQRTLDREYGSLPICLQVVTMRCGIR